MSEYAAGLLKDNLPRTHRGFRIFDEFEDSRSNIRVQESSAAGEGAHCWVFSEGVASNGVDGDYPPHLSVEQAERLIAALQLFIDEARAGELMEPAEATA